MSPPSIHRPAQMDLDHGPDGCVQAVSAVEIVPGTSQYSTHDD